MSKPIELATSQPGVIYSGGYGSGAGGCNIDDGSKLQIGTIQTHPRCRISLYERPFATVPYLGRGWCSPVIESQLMQGEQTTNKKCVSNLGETSHYNYQKIPLLNSTQTRMNNYNNAISSVPRSGANTKDMYNDSSSMQ